MFSEYVAETRWRLANGYAKQPEFKVERPGLKQAIRRKDLSSGETIHRIMLRDGFKCVYCGYDGGASYGAWRRRIIMTISYHRSTGGGNDDDNLVTACSDCNAYKAQRVFTSIPEAARWLRLYRHEIAKPWYEKHVVGKQSPSTWNNGEGKQRIEGFWKRFNNQWAEQAEA